MNETTPTGRGGDRPASEYATRFTYGPGGSPEEKGRIQREVERYFDISLPDERAAARSAYKAVVARFGEQDTVTDRDIAEAAAAETPQDVGWRTLYGDILHDKLQAGEQ